MPKPNWVIRPVQDGRVAPGRSDVSKLEDVFLFPSLDFTGKSVLDIGCWDSYFSFRAEVSRVLLLGAAAQRAEALSPQQPRACRAEWSGGRANCNSARPVPRVDSIFRRD